MQKLILYLTSSSLLISCAGPSSPFGALNLVESPRHQESHLVEANPYIEINPSFKLYHKSYDLWVDIEDEMLSERKKIDYKIVYNDRVLKRLWETEEVILHPNNPHRVSIRFKDFRLNPLRDNRIVFIYKRDGDGKTYEAELKEPECPFNQEGPILSFQPFEIGKEYKGLISEISKLYGTNPSLLAALVAQESSFKIKSVSFAKAIGLTQVTNLASKELEGKTKNWPHYPDIENLSYYELKAMIFLDKINQKNEWRLDPKLSLEGGALYLKYLENYWMKPQQQELLETIYHANIPWSDIILASYNSGASRVKKAIISKGKRWNDEENLSEAKRYVFKIKSYCTAFHRSY